MEIVEVKQNWPDDLLRVDLTLGNYCNFKCWYCFPGCNYGTHKWPNYEIFTKNLSHLLDYYIKHTKKKKFDFHVMGGEIILWPKFLEFVKFFKEKYDCVFTLSTNASKDLVWWKTASEYLDYVKISSHHESTDISHVRDVADLLYKKNVIVVVSVLMDPNVWDKCMDAVEFYKKSRYKWSIKYLEIILQDSIKYNDEQTEILRTLRARGPNLFWFFMNNKSYKSKVQVKDTSGNIHKVKDQFLILERLNNFEGWECSLGVNWISVKYDGTVQGICGNGLFETQEKFNIFQDDFISKFQPEIEPTICKQSNGCWCGFETNMSKKKI